MTVSAEDRKRAIENLAVMMQVALLRIFEVCKRIGLKREMLIEVLKIGATLDAKADLDHERLEKAFQAAATKCIDEVIAQCGGDQCDSCIHRNDAQCSETIH